MEIRMHELEREREDHAALEALLQDYIAVCNRALAENGDSFLFRQAGRLSRLLLDGAHVRALVYDEDPDNIRGEFMIAFDSDMKRLNLVPADSEDAAFTWKAPLDYLRDVAVDRPEWYIERPMMLDWRWIAERTGDEVERLKERPGALALGLSVLAGVALAALTLRPRRR